MLEGSDGGLAQAQGQGEIAAIPRQQREVIQGVRMVRPKFKDRPVASRRLVKAASGVGCKGGLVEGGNCRQGSRAHVSRATRARAASPGRRSQAKRILASFPYVRRIEPATPAAEALIRNGRLASSRDLRRQFGGQFALVTGPCQFDLAGVTRSVAAGNGGGTIGSAADDLGEGHLALVAVG